MPEKIKIINARVVTPFRVIPQGSVLISEGKIIAVSEGTLTEYADTVIDAGELCCPRLY